MRDDLIRCPVCGMEAFYLREMDRYYHRWGADNIDCWVKLSTGEVTDDQTAAL